MNGNSEAERGDLQALLGMVRQRAGLIVIGFVVGVVVALGVSEQQAKKYESSAALLFRPLLVDVPVPDQPISGQPGPIAAAARGSFAAGARSLQGASDPAREIQTNLGLVSLPAVQARAAARLGAGYTASRINNEVEVKVRGRSNILDVKASAATPEAAARVANTVAGEFVSFRRVGLRDQVRSAIARTRAQLRRSKGEPAAQQRARHANLQRLQLLALAQTGDVQLVQPATPPSSPASSKAVPNSIIGGVLGLLVGLGFALAAGQMDRRIQHPKDLEDALDLPLLTAVPRSKALRKRYIWPSVDRNGDVEAFRRLRASLRYFAPTRNQIRFVVITSPGTESGKTTVALHLAATAAAGSYGKVLLIEADLGRPRLAQLLGVSDRADGLSTLLHSSERLDDEPIRGVIEIPPNHGGTNGTAAVARSTPVFHALVAGPRPSDPAGRLDSERMWELLRIARRRYELIVMDAPPPTFVSETIPLMKQADGVILVGRLGLESTPALEQLRSEFERLAIKPLGAVANFSPRVRHAYYASTK
jgi:Mrp family chromosome partitioning ATPase/capsular polysaccharide biosynthesis protein